MGTFQLSFVACRALTKVSLHLKTLATDMTLLLLAYRGMTRTVKSYQSSPLVLDIITTSKPSQYR